MLLKWLISISRVQFQEACNNLQGNIRELTPTKDLSMYGRDSGDKGSRRVLIAGGGGSGVI